MKKNTRKRPATTKPSKVRERTFSTLQELKSHFFPEQNERIAAVKGEKRGADVATRAFAGITNSR
jgi:hypothetical protein